MDVVREAIAKQDYKAAREALKAARKVDPGYAGLNVYESIIKERESGQRIDSESSLRTPKPGAAPLPVVVTPIPSPTPYAPAVTPPSAVNSPVSEKPVAELMENPMYRYGAMGIGALILVGLILFFLKKRKGNSEDEEFENSSEAAPAFSGLGESVSDHTNYGDPLGGPSSVSQDEEPPSGIYGTPAFPADPSVEFPSAGASAGTSGLSGSDIPSASGGFGVLDVGDDEEEEAKPKPPPKPAPKVEEESDTVNLSMFGDSSPADVPSEPKPATGAADQTASFETLGIPLPGAPEPSMDKPAESGPTPSKDATGAVNLEDILNAVPPPSSPAGTEIPKKGSHFNPPLEASKPQPSPAKDEKPAEDETTLDSLWESLGMGPSKESTVETRPEPKKPEPSSGSVPDVSSSDTIDFSFLTMPGDVAPASGKSAESKDQPAETVSDEKPDHPQSSIKSWDDALGDTLALAPGETVEKSEPEPAPEPEEIRTSDESLDDRSERMFNEQMDRARKAFEEKNWRQAVHFLSIAAALHPDNEEAKSLLSQARQEKRKAEESV